MAEPNQEHSYTSIDVALGTQAVFAELVRSLDEETRLLFVANLRLRLKTLEAEEKLPSGHSLKETCNYIRSILGLFPDSS